MKAAIVGSSGYIASFLLERFAKEPWVESVLKIDQIEDADVQLDLACAETFDYSALEGIDFVVFTAAISGPDKCATDFDLCWKINVDGTRYFIQKALAYGCRVLFFSSDAVFGDIPGYIYTEDSETRAQTPYGRMKKAIEDSFKEMTGFKAIRLSYVASARDRFVRYCFGCMERGETAEVFHPFYRNCIVVSDVVDVVVWLAKHWEQYQSFVLNVAGKELVSRVRIADELNRMFAGKLRYSVVVPDEAFFRNRPRITQMKSLYLQRYQIIADDTFTEKLQREFKEGAQ